MVSHNHLSVGNSESSLSKDLFTEFGVSHPNSPDSLPPHLGVEDMVESAPILGGTGTNISSEDSSTNALAPVMVSIMLWGPMLGKYSRLLIIFLKKTGRKLF